MNLSFFGIGAGNPDELARGKRRTATYLSFLTFVFIVAAIDADDWVTGGVEFDVGGPMGVDVSSLPPEIREVCAYTGTSLEDMEATLAERAAEAIAQGLEAPTLGATVTPKFHLGLTRYTQGGQTIMRYSGAIVERDCYYSIGDELDNINAATKLNYSFWYGTQTFSVGTFNATFGLLAFASFLQFCMWIGFICIAYDAPYISTHPKTMLGLRILCTGSAFFTFVGVVYFASSGVQKSFCNAFDPDTNLNGTFCGYQTGFDLGITALVFGIIQTLAMWLWIPADVTGVKYEFSGNGGGNKGGYEAVGAPEGESAGSSATVPIAASSYQDFGSPSA